MRNKVIAAQAVIVLLVVVWFKVYLPRMEKARAMAEVLARENRIEAFYQSMAVEDSSREVVPPGGQAPTHPLQLRETPSVGEVEQALGAPGGEQRDFAGGMHLTWTGTRHTLEASFNHGRLYCLTFTDRQTGHGALVYESSQYWHPF